MSRFIVGRLEAMIGQVLSWVHLLHGPLLLVLVVFIVSTVEMLWTEETRVDCWAQVHGFTL